MTRPRTAPDHEPAFYDEEEAWDGAAVDDELPPRPRRRLVTPVTLGLTDVVRSKPGTVALCRSRVPSYAGIWRVQTGVNANG